VRPTVAGPWVSGRGSESGSSSKQLSSWVACVPAVLSLLLLGCRYQMVNHGVSGLVKSRMRSDSAGIAQQLYPSMVLRTLTFWGPGASEGRIS